MDLSFITSYLYLLLYSLSGQFWIIFYGCCEAMVEVLFSQIDIQSLQPQFFEMTFLSH
jgi:hypothetical protein